MRLYSGNWYPLASLAHLSELPAGPVPVLSAPRWDGRAKGLALPRLRAPSPH
jgi:hypothetical protein